MSTAAPTTRAVIYCRVSSKAQLKEGDGLASQENRCREYARHKGYSVVEVFRDEAVSGGVIDRPAMLIMLAYLRKHRAKADHVVIIDDISRLARGLQAHIELRAAIGGAGGKLESPSIEFGEDSDSILVENLLASVSQHQRQKNAEQVINRMRSRFLNGYWVFAKPLGYRYERSPGQGKILVPDEPKASVIREVLEGFASGRFASQVEVQRHLERYPNFLGKRSREIHLQKIRELLERPIYAGYMDAPKWGISLVQGKHTPLISFETHQRVLEHLNKPGKVSSRKDTREEFPLRGIVTCACCERPMTAAWSKGRNGRYAYYFCQTKTCADGRKSIRKETIEGDFEKLLDHLRPSDKVLDALKIMLRETCESLDKSQSEQRRTLKDELQQIERKSANIMERLMNADNVGVIAAYEEQVRGLHARKIELQEKMQKPARAAVDFDSTYRTAINFIANPRKLWDCGHLAARRTVPKLLFGNRVPYQRNVGYRTGGIAHPFRLLRLVQAGKYDLVRTEGLEPSRSFELRILSPVCLPFHHVRKPLSL